MDQVAASSAPAPAPRPASVSASWILTLAAGALVAASLAGSAGDRFWLLDLASHFRASYLVAAGLLLAAAAWCRDRWAIGLVSLALAWNAWLVLSYLPRPSMANPAGAAADAPAGRPVRIVALNVHLLNTDHRRVVDHLRSRGADVVALVEIHGDWAADLAALGDRYPHQFVRPRNDQFGLAILSAWPLVDPRVALCGGAPWPALVADVTRDDDRFTLVVVHPHPPFDAVTDRHLNAHLAGLGTLVAAMPGPCIVAGDFNATPWSAPFRRFVATSGLVDSARGRGIQPTWHARLWPLRIPIDHIFVPPGTRVLARWIGPDVGSDHFPVEADVVLPRP